MKNKEDNTVSIIQKAIRYFGIPVTNGTIKESLLSNPHYPTFKSICDVLGEWKIEHYPLKYQPDELKEIEPPYIAHFNEGGGQVAFVTKIQDNKVHYFNSYKSQVWNTLDKFFEQCSGAVILLNPDKESGDKEYKRKRQNEFLHKAILPVALGMFLIFSLLTILTTLSKDNIIDNRLLILFFTKIIGITFSILLLLHEFEVHNPLTDNLCHLNRATNCNTVLNDSSSKIFGWFGWADTGFIYFTGGFLVLLIGLGASDYSLLAIISAMSIPYPVYSVYYQGFVLKKWCPLCLGVQLVLISEFLILLPQFSNMHFSFTGISDFLFIFMIIGIIYISSIMYFREKSSNESNYFKYLGFKKNPAILRTLLLNQKYYSIPVTESSLAFGHKNTLMNLTIFLSLHCSHCARAFEKVKKILKAETKTSINIILITSDINILNTLYHLKRMNKDGEALEILDQWFNSDPYSRNKISETLCIPDIDDISDEVSNENLNLFKACDVIGTPSVFINGYLLPNQYDIDDIKYFSEVFTRKEAITS